MMTWPVTLRPLNRRAQVLPVLLREAVEGHHPLPVGHQELDCLRVRLVEHIYDPLVPTPLFRLAQVSPAADAPTSLDPEDR